MAKSITLLVLCFASLLAIFKELSLGGEKPHWGSRESFLLAAVAQGAIEVALVEGLSLLQALERNALLAGWVLVTLAAAAAFLILRIRRTGFGRKFLDFRDWNLPNLRRISRFQAISIVLAGLLLFTLALVAYFYPPNNWDSMTYHLPKVMHWVQDRSVAAYATNITNQIQLQPGAEFTILNLQMLTNSDQLFNLVQWLALVMCLIGVTVIAKKLGAGPGVQISAGLLCMTLPMAILQSTSTQNDLVVSAWLVCFVCLGMSLATRTERPWLWTFATGLALGLALFSKATAYIFALPFCIWIGAVLLRQAKKNLWRGALIAVLALCLNAGYFGRTLQVYGSPFGPQQLYTNDFISPASLASNLIRNTALHFSFNINGGLNTTPLLGWLRLVHETTGLSPTDPRTTWPNLRNVFAGFSEVQVFSEDYAPNPLHATAILAVSLCLLLFYRRLRRLPGIIPYLACLIGGFLIYSAVLKYQIWGSRLQLPSFILWAPALAVVIAQLSPRALKVMVAACGLASLLWVVGNISRPLDASVIDSVAADREVGYFMSHNDLIPAAQKMADAILTSKCRSIGLKFDADTWEYPVWILLADRGWNGRIEYVLVDNPSAALADPSFKPCAVIANSPDAQAVFPEFQMTKYSTYYLFEQTPGN